MEEQEDMGVVGEGVSRRGFLQGVGVTAAVGLGAAALAGCTSTETEEESPDSGSSSGSGSSSNSGSSSSSEVVVTELAIPIAEAPAVTSYEADVVVVGGGWAGLCACEGLTEQGYSVIVVDKAHPGFSGLSAWSNSFHWFDPVYDDADVMRNSWRIAGDYLVNLNWYDLWIERSEEARMKTLEWGVHEQYDTASDADPDYDYAAEGDTKGYLQNVVGDKDRHWMFSKVIENCGATLVDFTMVTDVIEDGGRIVGAVGFNVQSGTIIDFACKAVIMCTGPGSYKPNGYPTGSSTFDGDYIGYHHGLPVSGKEWSDFHWTSNADTGSVYSQWIGHYLQSIWPTGEQGIHGSWPTLWAGGITQSVDGVSAFDPYPVEEEEGSSSMGGGPPSSGSEEESGDIRGGDNADSFSYTDQENASQVCYQPSAGLSVHKSEGVFTGIEATCATSIPGLYYAGDSLSSSSMGCIYWGIGFSSCQSCTMGYYAAEEAGAYVANAAPGYITAEVLAEQTAIIQEPMTRTTGFDATWLRDVLSAIMTPSNVSTYKSAADLNAALTYVEWIRDVNIPKLAAVDAHELRMCWEMKSRVLNAEMRLRASLAREESRGRHYRADFPYRDDENFLCYITLTKGADGNMEVGKVDLPDEFVGDLTLDYAERYLLRFPGEQEALGFVDHEYSTSEITAAANARAIEEAS